MSLTQAADKELPLIGSLRRHDPVLGCSNADHCPGAHSPYPAAEHSKSTITPRENGVGRLQGRVHRLKHHGEFADGKLSATG